MWRVKECCQLDAHEWWIQCPPDARIREPARGLGERGYRHSAKSINMAKRVLTEGAQAERFMVLRGVSKVRHE